MKKNIKEKLTKLAESIVALYEADDEEEEKKTEEAPEEEDTKKESEEAPKEKDDKEEIDEGLDEEVEEQVKRLGKIFEDFDTFFKDSIYDSYDMDEDKINDLGAKKLKEYGDKFEKVFGDAQSLIKEFMGKAATKVEAPKEESPEVQIDNKKLDKIAKEMVDVALEELADEDDAYALADQLRKMGLNIPLPER
jgi:hypothetical protein